MYFGLKRLTAFLLLALILAGCFTVCAEETLSWNSVSPNDAETCFGYSEMGRELHCYRIGNPDAEQSLLMVYGVHGFEDAFDHDGEVLKMIAENVASHFRSKAQTLENFCLYIVPCANPDGLADGFSSEGFGRCNANGLDINRDFPSGWSYVSNTRHKTGDAPFSTAEARAIELLVHQIQPTYGIDVHGWIEFVSGNGKMARMFSNHLVCHIQKSYTGGTLAKWLEDITKESIMIELPYKPNTTDYVIRNSQALIGALEDWMEYCLR